MNRRCVRIVQLATLSAVVIWIGCSKSTDVARPAKNINQRSETIASSIPDPAQPPSTQDQVPSTQDELEPMLASATASEKPQLDSQPKVLSTDSPAVMERQQAAATTSVEARVDQSESVAQTASAQDVLREDDAAPMEPSFRLLLPTTAGPLVVDVEIKIGDQALESAFNARVERVMDEASGGSSELSWTSLFQYVAADRQQFGRASMINAQQYRDLIRRYDRNRNKKPDHDEVAKFVFRNAGYAGPFRLIGSNYFRELNRSQSTVFAALDRNASGVLESDEVDRAGESLRRLDRNADERLDASEITPVSADDNPAWKNRRSSRWGEEAMDLSGYIDWSMLSYALDEMQRHGPFGRKQNSIARLDQDHDGSIDSDEARDLLTVESDLRLSLRYPHAATDQAGIEITSVSSDLGSLVELTQSTDQIRISGSSLRLTASVSDVRAAGNQIPPQAFAMLDANHDGGLEKSEIPPGALREYSFEDLDQDSDDQLTLRELNEGMSPKSPIWSVQVRARGAEVSDGVFAWLDQNQDQFLSTREINDSVHRLRESAAADGSVRPLDIPDSYWVRFVRGDPDQDEQLFALAPAPSATTDSDSDSWPRWAQSMDTNRDGEISSREFLGTIQQFDKLDNNADGFIDSEELAARI